VGGEQYRGIGGRVTAGTGKNGHNFADEEMRMTVIRTDLASGGGARDWGAEFSTICDTHRPRLVRWLTAIFGPRDAEDIAQEALTRLYVRPDLLDDPADAWPWLAVVARNVGRDLMRHRSYTTTVDSGTLDLLPAGARVHEQVVARDDADRLVLALRSISPRDRWLIQLRDVDGVPVADIADTLGINDNAVRQQLFRARRRLAGAYTALGGDRRSGLVAALSLRFREFTRRHGHLFHGFGPSTSGMFASVAPAIAALLGGALFTATAPPVVYAGASAAAIAPGDLPHLSDVAGGRPAGEAAAGQDGRTGPPPPEPTVLTVDHEIGPARSTGFVEYPFSNEPGSRWDVYVEVDLPVVGPEYVHVRESGYSGRGGPVCRTIGCPTALPTPPARR
jgi:RNA polymerase sigma-70 factor (ECF subfamily)